MTSQSQTALLDDEEAKARAAIACYSLPYGGIGFASHVLTYWSMGCLFFGRKPFTPWRRVHHHRWNRILGCATLVATIVATSLSIHNCLGDWPFVALGVWMLTTSIASSAMAVWMPYFYRSRLPAGGGGGDNIELDYFGYHGHEAMQYAPPHTPAGPEGIESRRPRWRDIIRESAGAKWLLALVLLLWFAGCLAGIVAVWWVSSWRYDYETQHGTGPMTVVSIVFGGLCFFPLAWLGFKSYLSGQCCSEGECCSGMVLSVPFICVFALFWMDWALAIITGNLAGSPGNDRRIQAIFWIYFLAKRLPLFSL